MACGGHATKGKKQIAKARKSAKQPCRVGTAPSVPRLEGSRISHHFPSFYTIYELREHTRSIDFTRTSHGSAPVGSLSEITCFAQWRLLHSGLLLEQAALVRLYRVIAPRQLFGSDAEGLALGGTKKVYTAKEATTLR